MRASDPGGEGYYVIAVFLVYGMSIVLLIASHIRRKHAKLAVDREICKYLQEFQVVKETSSRDSYRRLKRSIVAKLSRDRHVTVRGGRAALPVSVAALSMSDSDDDDDDEKKVRRYNDTILEIVEEEEEEEEDGYEEEDEEDDEEEEEPEGLQLTEECTRNVSNGDVTAAPASERLDVRSDEGTRRQIPEAATPDDNDVRAIGVRRAEVTRLAVKHCLACPLGHVTRSDCDRRRLILFPVRLDGRLPVQMRWSHRPETNGKQPEQENDARTESESEDNDDNDDDNDEDDDYDDVKRIEDEVTSYTYVL